MLYTFFCSFTLRAQNDFETTETEALNLFKAQDYVKSQQLYSLLLSQFPKKGEYAFRLGVCMLYSEADKKKPLNYFKRASTDPEFKNPELYFYLGRAYQLNYRFDEAIPYFVEFKQRAKKALQREFKPDDFIAASLHGKYLISSSAELDVFSRKELQLEDYFRSYSSESMGGKLLSKPEDFKTKTDRKRRDKSVVYLPKQSTRVYFSSYGDEGLQRDIYVSERGKDGIFGKAQLVKGINSPQDEDFPFLHPNGKRMYFSSKGFNSMGGYDIFVSTWNENTSTWNAPQNLEFPINSPDDDFLFVTDSTDQVATFSTTRMSAFGKVTVLTINNPNAFTTKDTIALAKLQTDAQAREEFLAQVLTKAELNVNHNVSATEDSSRINTTVLSNTEIAVNSSTTNPDKPITIKSVKTPTTNIKNELSTFSNSEIILMERQELNELNENYNDLLKQIADAQLVSDNLSRETQEMLSLARKEVMHAEAMEPSSNQKTQLNEAQMALQDAQADSLTALRVLTHLQNLQHEAKILNQERALNQRYITFLEQAQTKKSSAWMDSVRVVEDQLAALENQHVKKSELVNPIALQSTTLPVLNNTLNAFQQNQFYLTVKQRDTLLPKIPSPLLSTDSINIAISSKSIIQQLERQLEHALSKPITNETELKQVNTIFETLAFEKKKFNTQLADLYKQKIVSSRDIINNKIIVSNYSSDYEYFEKKLVAIQNRLSAFNSDSNVTTAQQLVFNETEGIYLELSRFLNTHAQTIATKDSMFSKTLTAYYVSKVKASSPSITLPDTNKNKLASAKPSKANEKKSIRKPQKNDLQANALNTENSVTNNTKKQNKNLNTPVKTNTVSNTFSTKDTAALKSNAVSNYTINSKTNLPPNNNPETLDLARPIDSFTQQSATTKTTISKNKRDTLFVVNTQTLIPPPNSKAPLNKPIEINSASINTLTAANADYNKIANVAVNPAESQDYQSTDKIKPNINKDTANLTSTKSRNDSSLISSAKNSKTNKNTKTRIKSDSAFNAKSIQLNDTVSIAKSKTELKNRKRKIKTPEPIQDSSVIKQITNDTVTPTASEIENQTKTANTTTKTQKDAAVSASVIATSPEITVNNQTPLSDLTTSHQSVLTSSLSQLDTTAITNSTKRDNNILNTLIVSKDSLLNPSLDTLASKTNQTNTKNSITRSAAKIGAYSELAFPDGIVFRVQLAAVKNPLKTLVFKNQDSVYVNLNTTNWYCYQKGNYFTYERALFIRNKVRLMGYKDAYIVIYNNGVYMKWSEYKLNTAQNTKPVNNYDTPTENYKTLDNEADVFYTIQLGVYAPKRKPRFTNYVKPIFTETLKNGTIRFYTTKLRTFKNAKLSLIQLQNLGFDDAFIVAFKNGARILIKEARTIEKPNGTEQVLQLKKR
ncbi:MAG: hypothetical protein ACO291_06610 [Bacteroidia bacterium]